LKDGGDRNRDPWELIASEAEENRMREPFPVAPVATQSADEAYREVMKSAGANLPRRDAVDERIIRQLEGGTGERINSPAEVGGWPELRSQAAPDDRDEDGLPDAWERKHALAPDDPTDGAADGDGDGYTNLEEFLNATDPTRRDGAE
jgi:hypothetical protein